MVKDARIMDLTFALVTLFVFGGLAAATVAAVEAAGVSAIVFFFIVWIAAVGAWAKVTREWLNEHEKMRREESIESRLVEEIEKLREAIEALRKSLET